MGSITTPLAVTPRVRVVAFPSEDAIRAEVHPKATEQPSNLTEATNNPDDDAGNKGGPKKQLAAPVTLLPTITRLTFDDG